MVIGAHYSPERRAEAKERLEASRHRDVVVDDLHVDVVDDLQVYPHPRTGEPVVDDERGYPVPLGGNNRAAPNGSEAEPSSSWRPVDIAKLLEAGLERPEATMLARQDGVCLIYPGKITAVAGPPETGKSFMAKVACVEQIDRGEHVVYIDFEADAASVLERMLALGPTPHELAELFHYVTPDGPFDDVARREVLDLVERHKPTMVVLDGIAEAMVLNGLDENSNRDVATFYVRLPRLLEAHGCAVFLIDHVVKDPEAQGRYARGGGHKLAGVTVAYKLEAGRPFGRGLAGESKLTLSKDRLGALGASCPNRRAGELVVDDTGDRLRVYVRAPETGPFRPTHLMERISLLLEESPEPLSLRAVRDGIKGKNDAKDVALNLLAQEGYVERSDGPRGATLHRSVRPFREAEDG